MLWEYNTKDRIPTDKLGFRFTWNTNFWWYGRVGLICVCGVRGHKAGRRARGELGRLNIYGISLRDPALPGKMSL